LPPAGAATAPIVFLAPTFTYQIYGNHQRGNVDDAFRARQAAWGAYPWNAEQHAEYGASTYNTHPDGSGICYSSLRRPLLTMRPGYITYFDDRGSGLRHFPADTHLIDWLTVKAIPFDVITDHDLDREGAALLQPYRAVVTGSHPEYHTPNTLNALQDYIIGGGRLAYLGGNGFYWRIAKSPATRMSSKSAAPKGVSAPGRASRASITTCWMADMAVCGAAMAGRLRCCAASAFPRKGCSRDRTTGACRTRQTRALRGSSRALTTAHRDRQFPFVIWKTDTRTPLVPS